jgi:predicted transcriptional regulator
MALLGPFGSLETRIMAVLWDRPGLSVREVVDRVNRRRPLAYTTVMTVMNRLVTKGQLRRVRDGAGFRYTPTVDRSTSAARAARASLAALVHAFGPEAVAGFVDALDGVDPKLIAALKRRTRR